MSGPHGEDQSLDGAPVPELEPAPEPPAKASRAGSLKHKTATSILWTVVHTGSDYLFSFLVFAVLARKLGPAAFGVFALAVAFAELGRSSHGGLVSALGRARHVSPEMADTVFWSSLALAVPGRRSPGAAGAPIAGALGEPAVAPLLMD